jgi:hypothetical protein
MHSTIPPRFASTFKSTSPVILMKDALPYMKWLALCAIATGCLSCCAHLITPGEMTRTAIMETFVRIDLYAKQKGQLPSTLAVLAEREGYVNRTTDGWGRPLQYHVDGDGVITLASLGRDGKPGGSGADADISESYYSRRKDGTLWVGAELWIAEAMVRGQR